LRPIGDENGNDAYVMIFISLHFLLSLSFSLSGKNARPETRTSKVWGGKREEEGSLHNTQRLQRERERERERGGERENECVDIDGNG
jgi:hypothetical protein